MFLDAQTLLWDATALSADAESTNAYDLALTTNDPSKGEPLVAVITVDVAADYTTGNETYQFNVIQSANSNLSSPDVLLERVIAAADLTAGSIHIMPIPQDAITKRYLGLQYDGGGTTPTITVTGWICPASMIHVWDPQPNGYTITG